MDLEIIPYGNARTSSTGVVTCQHGALECYGNKLEVCTLHHYPVLADYWPMINCVEGRGSGLSATTAQSCATSAGLDWTLLDACMNSAEGDQLIQEARKATDAAGHSYVPWITVNGAVLSDPSTLLSHICGAYTGDAVPVVCTQHHIKAVDTTATVPNCPKEVFSSTDVAPVAQSSGGNSPCGFMCPHQSAYVGAAVGGLAALAVIAFAVVRYRRRGSQPHTQLPEEEEEVDTSL